MNIYELSSPEIADALHRRHSSRRESPDSRRRPTCRRHVDGFQRNRFANCSGHADRRGDDRLFEMTSKAGGKRRFHYDHAKYVVIDETTLLVGSENYSPTGNPQPGSVGNRGWEVMIHDADPRATVRDRFSHPTRTLLNRDVMDITSLRQSRMSCFSSDILRNQDPTPQQPPTRPPVPTRRRPRPCTASAIDKITSPDTSLSGLKALLRFGNHRASTSNR